MSEHSPENKGIQIETKEGGTAASMTPSRSGVEVEVTEADDEPTHEVPD